MTNHPGHLWHDTWTALSGLLSLSVEDQATEIAAMEKEAEGLEKLYREGQAISLLFFFITLQPRVK